MKSDCKGPLLLINLPSIPLLIPGAMQLEDPSEPFIAIGLPVPRDTDIGPDADTPMEAACFDSAELMSSLLNCCCCASYVLGAD